MAVTTDYVEQDDLAFANQLVYFKNGLIANSNALKIKYNFSDQDITDITNDAAYTLFVVNAQRQVPDYSKAFTEKKDENRKGTGYVASAFPPVIVTTGGPTAVLPGTEKRFRERANKVKASTVYSVTDGETLEIVKKHHPFVPGDGKPDLKEKLVDGGHPQLHVTKGHFQGFELWKDDGTGNGFQLLDKPGNPRYVDNSDLPPTSAVWKYKAIYRLNDKQVGHWSDIVTVTVHGE